MPRILAAAWLYLHPENYNLHFPQYSIDTATLTVKRDTSLDELCICFGQAQDKLDGWFRVLRNLNPRLDPEDLIKAGDGVEIPTILMEVYEQKCLVGELLDRARQLHEARYPEMTIYTVVAGDTLGQIAARSRCTSQSELATINNLRPPRYLIRAGQTLKIPGCR